MPIVTCLLVTSVLASCGTTIAQRQPAVGGFFHSRLAPSASGGTVSPSYAGPKARSPIKFPDWAKQGRKSPAGRILFSTFIPFTKDDPLEPAGLLGPVVLRCGVIAEMK